MDGPSFRGARRVAGLTQSEAARRLGVSQPYLSQLEGGERPWPPELARRAARLYRGAPTMLPLPGEPDAPDPERSFRDLASLGYPRFAPPRRSRPRNPALVLLEALLLRDIDPRLLEALPWLIARHPDMDWDWLLPRAKIADLQNRLGFLVSLAREIPGGGEGDVARRLADVESRLEPSRLLREDPLGFDSMPEPEREHRRRRRSPLAAHWNVLSTLTARELRHG